MKTTGCAVLLWILFIASASAQYYSRQAESDLWQARHDAREAQDEAYRVRQQAEMDRWESNNQLRYAEEDAARARREAADAEWRSKQNNRYSW